jgi:RND family efflux transporter MFP subunit
MNFSKTCALSGLVLAATLLAGCEQPAVETPEIVRPVRLLTISGLSAGDTLSYPGEIQGVQNAELAFEVGGRLVELPVREGVIVDQNQLLAQLDQTDFRANLDAAEARVRQSQQTFERFSEVFERGAISRQELDTRRRQFEVEQAQLESARKALNDASLRAPFAGRVGRTYVDNFNNVQAKQPILLLQDLSQLEAVVNVPEQDWLRARPGLTLAQRTEVARPEVSLSSIPGRSFPATITEVAAAADPVTRTFEARARFDPPDDLQILPGMAATVTVKIPANLEEGQVTVYLPASAVDGGNDGGSFVWKVDSDSMTVSQAPVTVGQLSGSEVEIVDGLSTGDRIAVSGVQHLRDGMRIRELQN